MDNIYQPKWITLYTISKPARLYILYIHPKSWTNMISGRRLVEQAWAAKSGFIPSSNQSFYFSSAFTQITFEEIMKNRHQNEYRKQEVLY